MTLFESVAARSLLPLVAKPGRYRGPLTSAPPDRFDRARLRVAIVHPVHLETGLGHLPTRGSFRAVESVAGAAADLAFLPWSDLDERLAQGNRPYWGFESGRSLAEFDVILFTPPNGFSFLEIPRILRRAGLAPMAADRRDDAPVVAVIGSLMANPLPLADLADWILLGEPEGVLPALVTRLVSAAGTGMRTPRGALLEAGAGCPGTWNTATPFEPCSPILADDLRLALDEPRICPVVEAAAEGCHLDIRRGSGGERFRFSWRPAAATWTRASDDAMARVDQVLKETGVDRVDLAGDDAWRHPDLASIVESINRRFPGVRIALDDWGVGALKPWLAREIFRGRRGPVTLSPWAATESLRAALGVAGTNDELLESAATAVRGGAGPVTVRFGLGWPGETAADRAALINLVRRLKVEAGITAGQRLMVEVSPYVPTPGSELAGTPSPDGFEGARESEVVTEALTGEAGVSIRVVPAGLAAIETRLLNGGRDVGARLVAAFERGAITPDPIRPWDPTAWIAAFEASPGASESAWHQAGSGWSAAARSALLAPTIDDTPIPAAALPSAAAPLSADTAGYGRKSRRKAPASMRPASRYRVRFAKTEALRYTSHLDVGRLVERALRRLERTRPAWYNRSVKLSFGPPLPLGWTGEDEFVDLLFPEDVPETLPQALAEVLPAGLEMIDVKPIRASVESLSHAIDRARYSIPLAPEWLDAVGAEPGARLTRLTDAVARLKTAREILVRKSPEDEIHRLDVRSGVLGAQIETIETGEARLALHLTLGVPGSVRPEVLLAHLLGDDAETARLAPVHRAALRIAGNGKEFSPMEVVELDFPWWRESPRRTAAGGPRA